MIQLKSKTIFRGGNYFFKVIYVCVCVLWKPQVNGGSIWNQSPCPCQMFLSFSTLSYLTMTKTIKKSETEKALVSRAACNQALLLPGAGLLLTARFGCFLVEHKQCCTIASDSHSVTRMDQNRKQGPSEIMSQYRQT